MEASGRYFALAIFAVGLSSVAQAKVSRDYSIGNWYIGVIVDDKTKSFSSCSALASYKSGVTLGFVVTKNLRWSIAFTDPRWNLRVGEEINGAYRVDSGPIRTTTSFAVGSQSVRADLPDNTDVFNDFRRGKTLYVTAGGDVLPFALTDTARMLTELVRCAKDSGRPAQSPNMIRGASNQPAATERRSTGPTTETRLEATLLATNVLNAAGIFGFEFLRPEDLPGELGIHDATWRSAGQVGTLRILAGERAASTDQVRGTLLAGDGTACKAKFASGVIPSEREEQNGFSLFTACEGKDRWTNTYIVVPRPKGGHYLFSFAGKEGDGSEVKATANLFRNAAFSVLKDR